MTSPSRPTVVFDAGMQQERTAMAWERTAFNQIIVGAAIGRVGMTHQGSDSVMVLATGVGLLAVVIGVGMLYWSVIRYENLHGTLRAGEAPVHPRAAAVAGSMAVTLSLLALALGIAEVVA